MIFLFFYYPLLFTFHTYGHEFYYIFLNNCASAFGYAIFETALFCYVVHFQRELIEIDALGKTIKIRFYFVFVILQKYVNGTHVDALNFLNKIFLAIWNKSLSAPFWVWADGINLKLLSLGTNYVQSINWSYINITAWMNESIIRLDINEWVGESPCFFLCYPFACDINLVTFPCQGTFELKNWSVCGIDINLCRMCVGERKLQKSSGKYVECWQYIILASATEAS